MRITSAVMQGIPLPAAWIDGSGHVVAQTPEWRGGGLGFREYRAGRHLRLLVSPGDTYPAVDTLTRRLLDELAVAVAETAAPARYGLQLATTALGVVAGRGDHTTLTEQQIADAVAAACALENDAPAVDVEQAGSDPVAGGWLVAAAMKQLVMNARKHEGCDRVRLRLHNGWVSVSWVAGRSGSLRGIATSRHRLRRSGWGLGVVRFCCDAVGASYLAPHDDADGMTRVAVVLEPESSCLRLPLALLSTDGRVLQATRTWDAESGAVPGRTSSDPSLMAALHAARSSPARITQHGPWSARVHANTVHIALRPSDTREQGLDLLDGIAHEAELLVGGRNSAAWLRAVAVLEALRLALGQPAPAYASDHFRRDLVRYGRAFGADLSHVQINGTSAPPPALTAFLLTSSGGGTLARDSSGWHVRTTHHGAPELAGLATADGVIRIPLVDDVAIPKAVAR